MEYVIQIGEEAASYTHAVDPADAAYLREVVIPRLRPLSDQEYSEGPAAILHTMAPFSYVLDGPQLYWCVPWNPGLLVIRFSPAGAMAWAAFRSPNPEFGGREATDAEWDAYDEDAEDPQYNLVFDAWDARFDEELLKEWSPAAPDTQQRFDAALAHVNALGEELQRRYSEPSAYQEWLARCKENPIWKGDLAMG
jgi:hypothetical protein